MSACPLVTLRLIVLIIISKYADKNLKLDMFFTFPNLKTAIAII